MTRAGLTPDQRRRDGRLAWLIVGCSAALTLVLLGVGLIMARGLLARWVAQTAASGDRPALVAMPGEVRKAGPGDARIGGAGASDPAPAVGDLHKRAEGGPATDEDGTARRGGEGDAPRRALRREAEPGPTA